MKLSDRRIDPRTDSSYSLQNLLRVRSERHALALALLLTPEGMLMAGNEANRAAERLAAHTARELFLADGPERLTRHAPRPGARLAAIRFQSRGRPLALAVLCEQGELAAEQVEDLASRVRAILHEADQRAALAA